MKFLAIASLVAAVVAADIATYGQCKLSSKPKSIIPYRPKEHND
jgi:hypothetical protein